MKRKSILLLLVRLTEKVIKQIPLIVVLLALLLTTSIEFFVYKRMDLLPANIPIIILLLLYVITLLRRSKRGNL